MQLDLPFQLCNRSAMRDMKKFSFVSFWLLQSVLPTRPDFSRLFRKLDDGVRIHSDCYGVPSLPKLPQRKQTAVAQRKQTAVAQRKQTAVVQRKQTAVAQRKQTAVVQRKQTAVAQRKQTSVAQRKQHACSCLLIRML